METTAKMRAAKMHELSFLRTELLTGLTFFRIAHSTRDAEKRSRNRINARKAYDTILRFLPGSIMSVAEENEVRDKLHRLKLGLQELGEDV